MFDDPDSDWTLIQRLAPALPPTPLQVPGSASPSLVEALSPPPPEKEAQALDVPPLREPETVWALAWSPDGLFLASGGDGGGVRLWERVPRAQAEEEEIGEMEVATGMEMREVSHTLAHAGAVFALAWGPGPDAGGLLASGGADGRIIVWEVAGGQLVPIAGAREAHGVADVNGLGWNVREDGKGAGILASAADDGSVKVWRVVADE
jgi:WD40 repeat protein